LRRRVVGAALACLIAVPAAAQDAGQPTPPAGAERSTPLGPLGGPGAPQVAPPLAPLSTPQIAPSSSPPAASVQPPGTPPSSAATTFTPAPPAAENWLPRGTAEVQALDKVNARNAILSVKVGDTAKFGSLTIAVQACVVTPPDQPQDAAAFLVITDSHDGEPGFSGWMVAQAPSASMLQNPIYDVRVTGCRT
jgi:hypothetical protein